MQDTGRGLIAVEQEWKRTLLRRGSEIAELLSALLAHKEVNLTSLPAKLLPEDDPELRLRRFLDQIDRAIKAWGTERYGRCGVCGEDLATAVLAATPWADFCSAHAFAQEAFRPSRGR